MTETETRLYGQRNDMISPHAHFDNQYYTNIRGVVQIGMGGGSYEIDTWRKIFGIRYQIYIEAYPPYYESLITKVESLRPISHEEIRIFNYAMSNKNSIVDFYVNSVGDSHSLFKMDDKRPAQLKNMKEVGIVKIQARTLDSLIEQEKLDMTNYNLLFMDTQGSEHLIIQGAKSNMKYFDVVTAEIQHIPAYNGALLYGEFTEMMESLGFKLEQSNPNFVDNILVTSDVLYIRI